MTTFAQVIQAAIPDADEDMVNYVLWDRTPFPFRADPREIYKLASGFRRAHEHGIILCEMCSNRREGDQKYLCRRCAEVLS